MEGGASDSIRRGVYAPCKAKTPAWYRAAREKESARTMQTKQNNLVLETAFAYAALGWKVFPLYGVSVVGFGCNELVCRCRAGGRCEHPGKHPACEHGFLDAACEKRILYYWFAKQPKQNIAIATGAASQILIVDEDRRNGGHETLAQLEREHGKLPAGDNVVITGNGRHIYLGYPPGAPIASGADYFGPGLDCKADGGYVVAPPSRHYSGKFYEWQSGRIPDRLPEPPPWLVKLARDGSARVHHGGGGRRNGTTPDILTKDHVIGRRIAEALGAKDHGSYWKLRCPACGYHGGAALYPRVGGRVYAICFAGCSRDEITGAIVEAVKND